MKSHWEFWAGLIILFLGIGTGIGMFGHPPIFKYIDGVIVGQISWAIIGLHKALTQKV